MKYWPTKTVEAVHDRGLDWGPTLNRLGDPSIVNSVWTRLRGSANVISSSIDPDGRRVYARVSGGLADDNTVWRNAVTLDNAVVLTEDVYMKTRA